MLAGRSYSPGASRDSRDRSQDLQRSDPEVLVLRASCQLRLSQQNHGSHHHVRWIGYAQARLQLAGRRSAAPVRMRWL
jgi:hypothetical protein